MARAVNCDCGEQIAANDDEELLEELREHYGEAHPDRIGMPDDDLRDFVADKAFDS